MGLSVTLETVVLDMMMGFLMLTTHIDGGCGQDDSDDHDDYGDHDD